MTQIFTKPQMFTRGTKVRLKNLSQAELTMLGNRVNIFFNEAMLEFKNKTYVVTVCTDDRIGLSERKTFEWTWIPDWFENAGPVTLAEFVGI